MGRGGVKAGGTRRKKNADWVKNGDEVYIDPEREGAGISFELQATGGH